MGRVNTARRYDARSRREQAQRTQEAILAAAREQFIESGYAATTVARIARQVGCSAETVYKAFGGKAGVVRALWQSALDGRGPVSAVQRSDELSSSESDPVRVLRGWGGFVTEVAPIVAPIMLLVRAAATSDAEMAQLLQDAEDERRERMGVNARRLGERGWLRDGVTVAHAADVLWTYSSSELYELLVVKSGWPIHRYGDFVGDALIAALL
ncbi:helix-turn-helix domain-containing protein [Kribbella sp. NPDC026611]|uniref:TetR/AcrR family transcriptional regulator n=1 Tax=Kribbella sp. NPDC026611 TaxID=3154911 RepID=UPI0033F1CA21